MCIMCMWVSQCMCVPADLCVCVCVCVITTGAGCIHEQNGCIIGDVHDTLLSVGVFFPFFFFLFSACCPDSNYWGFSRGGKARRWGEGACTAWFCQLTGCSVCGTARQPRIPGVRLGETQGLVISTNLNQKPEIVSCHTLFVIFDTLPLLWPRPPHNTYLHAHTFCHSRTHKDSHCTCVFTVMAHYQACAHSYTLTHRRATTCTILLKNADRQSGSTH